jgi:hydrogenase nickel incorporation protein HypA/HybF
MIFGLDRIPLRNLRLKEYSSRKANPMHELQVTERILEIALKYAEPNQVEKIVAIHLKIGELSDLEDEWIQKYFDYLSKGTIAEGAQLKIQRTPVVMECEDCGFSFEIDLKETKDILCPECGHSKCNLISGREYRIENMEVM